MRERHARMIAMVVLLMFVAMSFLVAGEKGKTHDLTAEIVSVDAEAKTLTIKDGEGNEKTVPVMEEAAGKLADLKAGEKVVLTCQDDADGEHTGVVGIKPAKG